MDHTNSGKNRIQTEQTIDKANTATQTERVSDEIFRCFYF